MYRICYLAVNLPRHVRVFQWQDYCSAQNKKGELWNSFLSALCPQNEKKNIFPKLGIHCLSKAEMVSRQHSNYLSRDQLFFFCRSVVQRRFRTSAYILTNHNTTWQSTLPSCAVIGWNIFTFQMVEISIVNTIVQRCAGRKPNGLVFRSYNTLAGSLTSWTLLLIWGIGTIWETVWECSVWSWSHLAAVARGFDWSNIWQKTAHFHHRSCAALTQKWHQPCSFWMYWEHLSNTETNIMELLNSYSNSLNFFEVLEPCCCKKRQK